MAIRYGYFDSEVTGVDENGMPVFDRAETSDLFRLLFANLVSSGVLATPGDCFKVNADTGLTVRIRPGFAMINGAFAYDAEESTVTLATADANLPRIDRVVLRCNYLNRLCEIITKTGTPASTPAASELLQPASGDYYELCLATIRVEAGATSVTQSAITDTRSDSSVCGLITQLIDHLDTSEFMDQLTAWQEEYTADQQAAFNVWFDEIKDQLSEDAAGHLQQMIASANTNIATLQRNVAGIINDETTGSNTTWSSEKIADHVQEDIDDATTWKQLRSTPFSPAGENYWVEIPQTAKEVIVSAHITYTPSVKVSVMFHVPVLPHFFTVGSIYAIVNYYGATSDGYARLDCSVIDGVNKVRLFALSNGTRDITASCSWDVFYR